jgi:lysophospholipase L1-like esterase
MRRSRTTPRPARFPSVAALVALLVLAPLTAGCGADASAAARGSEAEGEPGAVGDAGLLNDDGTVGPVVALGDSLTADTRDAAATGGTAYESWYVYALEDEPRLVDAYNAGIPRNTTPDMLARFRRDVAVHEPRVVVILGGTNDLPEGRTTEQVLATLEEIADRTRAIGATPVLSTIPPRTNRDYTERVDELNAAIRAAGEDTGTTVIDFFSVVADDDGGWRPGFSRDGVHPTRAAADAMAQLALDTLLAD